jgi:diguanylate cyclase (GGDEF)-like protein/PAS domain S-box-containing protein
MEWLSNLKLVERIPMQWSGRILGLAAASALAAALLPYWLVGLLALVLGYLVRNAMTTSRMQTDLALRESEDKFRIWVEQSLVGLYVVQNGLVVYASPKAAELMGYDSPSEIFGVPTRVLIAPEDLPRLRENHRRRLSGEQTNIHYTYRALRRDGKCIWIEVHGSVCEYQGRPAVLGIALDVSQRVEFEHRSRVANRVFEAASEGILTIDAERRIEAVNPAFTRITGYRAAQAIGKPSRIMADGGARAGAIRDMLAQLAQSDRWEGELLDRRQNGEWYPAWLSISAVRDTDKNLTNYVVVFTDNTRRKEAEARLHFLANHDNLTGTLNRSGMLAKFADQIELARADGRQLALLFIDLDRFKTVNDTLGHVAGDQLLATAADRMRRQLKGSDILARLGGDEFTVLLDELPSLAFAAKVAERLIGCMSQPFMIGGQEMFVTASIGVACYPGDGNDATTLLKNADAAMYRAKERGRNTFQFFSKDMDSRSFEKLLLENSLRHALARNEFELYYQPQIATATGRLTGVEVLIRWHHPELGLMQPETFIALAEQTGLIVPIGAWVLQEACRQCKAWLDHGFEIQHVAVNLSARQFSADGLLDTVRASLDNSGLPSTMLELEITESTIMHNPEEAVKLLHRLREMGVALSIDDFGTGYSSLASLKQYPLDSLKIDRSFVNGIPHDADDVAITEAIIAIGHKMQLKVVAEGVETAEQFAFLRDAGCEIAQGYLLGRPMPAAEFMRTFNGGERCDGIVGRAPT